MAWRTRRRRRCGRWQGAQGGGILQGLSRAWERVGVGRLGAVGFGGALGVEGRSTAEGEERAEDAVRAGARRSLGVACGDYGVALQSPQVLR